MGPLALVLLAACAAGPPDSGGGPYVVFVRQDDGSYDLAPRDVPTLADPRRLDGDMGTGFRGGVLTNDGYVEGGELDVDWERDADDAAVPLDEDGLVLWSFYADLQDAHDDLGARGIDTDAITPVRIAFSPASALDFAGVENAAYVLGQRMFVLLPDALPGLPLAANAGVVRHEFGHAVFELLVTGTVGGEIPWLSAPTQDQLGLRALNEGFADTVATLTLDDPDFISESIPMPSRDVTGDAVATPDLYPPSDADVLESLTYDPYALGTVYASFAWDVREATDPDTAFDLATGALAAWGAAGDWGDPDGYVVDFVALAQGDAKTAACASAAVRFPDLDVPGC